MPVVKGLNLTGESKTQEYYIKNKDKVLGVFTWDSIGTTVLLEDIALPHFIKSGVASWLESRTPDKHREHMKELLDVCGFKTTKDVLDFSKGLSLTDTLWVTSNQDLVWKDVNLFENEFDEVIARIAFDGGMHGLQFSTTSPEFSTDGMLAKCWIRNSFRDIILAKTGIEGFSNTGREPLSEVLGHQVLTCLDYPHVPYWLGYYRGKRVSFCDIMTSQRVMLLPIYKYYLHFQGIESILPDCERDALISGISQMLIYDYLSWNTDRHAGNLGVLLDADTFELLGFAPLWDHGCSMLAYYNGTDDLEDYVTRSAPALYNTFEWGAQYGKRILGNSHNVERLIDFEFDLSQTGDYPTEHILTVQSWLQGRVRKFLEM